MIRQMFGVGAMAVLLALAGVGCNNTIPEENTQPIPEAAFDPSGNRTGLGNGGDGMYELGEGGVSPWGSGADSSAIGGEADAMGWRPALDANGNPLKMPTIYFAYDSDVLVSSAQENLNRIAAYLSDKPELGLLIEGHCDQRGTEEYNRALGERRANAVRSYLMEQSVTGDRLRTISYGEDKPAVEGNGEEAWRLNRRAEPVPMVMPQR